MQAPHPHALRGSAMLLALLVILAGSFVLASWVMVMAAQVTFSEEASAALKRRVAYANSRALTEQFILQTMATSGGVPAGGVSLADGWGWFSIATGMSGSWTSLKSSATPTTLNPFSPGGPFGYTVSLDAVLSGNATRQFEIRSRSPLFGGHALTYHQPNISSPGGLTLNADLLLWPRTGGFPTPPLTSGETVSGSYSGFLPLVPMQDLIGAPIAVSPGSPGLNEGITGTKRVVTVDLNVLNLEGFGIAPDALLLHYALPSDAGSGNLTGAELTLQGGGANLPPLLITFQAGGINLDSIQLTGTNSRRVYLRIQNSVTFTLSGAGDWRLAMTLLDTPCLISTSTGLVLTGGIRTNDALTISGGVTLQAEGAPGGLERLADRVAWLESYAP